MANIRKLPSGKWNVRVRRNGHHLVTKTFTTQKTALQWARDIETDMDRGVFVDRTEAEGTTLAEALERYRREVTPSKKGKVQEDKRITQWLDNRLAKRSLASLKPLDFARYRDDRLGSGIASNTVRLELAIISHLFTIAKKEWGIAVQNPINGIRKPKQSNARTRRFEGDEEERLLAALRTSTNKLLYPLVTLAIETGMRQGELLSLTWEDVDLTKRIVYLSDTKNGTARIVPLSIRAVDCFRVIKLDQRRSVIRKIAPTNKNDSGLAEKLAFFPNSESRGNNLFPMFPRKAWGTALKKAGLVNFHFHDLRHEAVSRLFEKGLHPLEVASISGHKSIQMLNRYTHLRTENLLQKLDKDDAISPNRPG